MLQKHKSFSHVPLFYHLISNLSGFSLTDTLDFRKPLRFLLYDAEGILPKSFDNSLCKSFPDSFNCTGAEISLHADYVIRRYHSEILRFHLKAIHGMFHIIPLNFQCFSRFHIFKIADTNQFLFFFHEGNHCITILSVLINNMVNITFYFFHVFPF